MKNKRQAAILELIGERPISTQEELLAHLEEMGFHVTQATVSRDIREMKLYKGTGSDGIVRYRLAERAGTAVPKAGAVIGESVYSVACAGNLVVIKTYPGLANAVATYVDAMERSAVLGCVAGDDTIIAVATSEGAAVSLADQMRTFAGIGKNGK